MKSAERWMTRKRWLWQKTYARRWNACTGRNRLLSIGISSRITSFCPIWVDMCLSILTRRGSIPPLQGRTRFSLERRAMHRPSSTGSANPICGRTSMHWALLCTKRIPGSHMKKWSGAEGSCGLLSISVQILT